MIGDNRDCKDTEKYSYIWLKDRFAVILSLFAPGLFVSKSLYNIFVGIYGDVL